MFMSASARRRSRFAVAVALLGLAGLATAPATFAAAPANDVYAGRVTVTDGSHIEQDTTQATTDADDTELNATCGAPATDASVWFQLTGTDETYKIDFSGSNYSGGILVGTAAPAASPRSRAARAVPPSSPFRVLSTRSWPSTTSSMRMASTAAIWSWM
jgi:hypothetical protein